MLSIVHIYQFGDNCVLFNDSLSAMDGIVIYIVLYVNYNHNVLFRYCHHLLLIASSVLYLEGTYDGSTHMVYQDDAPIERQLCMLADYSRPIHCTDPDSLVSCTSSTDPFGIGNVNGMHLAHNPILHSVCRCFATPKHYCILHNKDMFQPTKRCKMSNVMHKILFNFQCTF